MLSVGTHSTSFMYVSANPSLPVAVPAHWVPGFLNREYKLYIVVPNFVSKLADKSRESSLVPPGQSCCWGRLSSTALMPTRSNAEPSFNLSLVLGNCYWEYFKITFLPLMLNWFFYLFWNVKEKGQFAMLNILLKSWYTFEHHETGCLNVKCLEFLF